MPCSGFGGDPAPLRDCAGAGVGASVVASSSESDVMGESGVRGAVLPFISCESVPTRYICAPADEGMSPAMLGRSLSELGDEERHALAARG